jgi:hypothetical protein
LPQVNITTKRKALLILCMAFARARPKLLRQMMPHINTRSVPVTDTGKKCVPNSNHVLLLRAAGHLPGPTYANGTSIAPSERSAIQCRCFPREGLRPRKLRDSGPGSQRGVWLRVAPTRDGICRSGIAARQLRRDCPAFNASATGAAPNGVRPGLAEVRDGRIQARWTERTPATPWRPTRRPTGPGDRFITRVQDPNCSALGEGRPGPRRPLHARPQIIPQRHED